MAFMCIDPSMSVSVHQSIYMSSVECTFLYRLTSLRACRTLWGMVLIPADEFKSYLKYIIGDESVIEFAKRMGVTRSAVYQLLSGKNQPSPELLKKLDLEMVYRQKKSKG